MASLELDGIRKAYGPVDALRGVSLAVGDGELLSVLGPSGSGKSTLLRVLAGLDDADAGRVLIGGRDVTRLHPAKRNVSMVFQSYALFPHMTVFENVAYPLQMRRVPRAEIRQRVDRALDLMRLAGLGGRQPRQLSGGQQQRVALARALALAPKVLLLDEPFSNLDANLRVHMRATLREIQRTVNITTIFVTHDQVEAMTMSDRLVVMNQGVVEQVGSPVEIYEKPRNEFVARFIGYVNILSGVVKDAGEAGAVVETGLGPAEVASGPDRLRPGEKIHLIVRPEAIRLEARPAAEGVNAFAGRIRSVMYAGSTVKYTVDVGGTELVVDEYDPTRHGIRRMGERVVAELPRHVHILRADAGRG